MARTKKEELDFQVDTTAEEENGTVVPVNPIKEEPILEQRNTTKTTKPLVNCLRNEKVIVRFIPRKRGNNADNPKHVLYGGMSNNAVKKYSLPILASSGLYKNPLTTDEKNYLESILDIDLSIYKKNDNFWDDSNGNGISQVVLTKNDNILDLSKPSDYLKYKILLANSNTICPSLQELQDRPKATYQFYIVNEEDEVKSANRDMSVMQQCYMEFGNIQNDRDTLRFIVEYMTNKPVAPNTKIEWLKSKINELIQTNRKMFLSTVTDSMLQTKVLIKKAIDAGIISYRGNQLYLREDNSPLCDYGQEPTFTVAAQYLNQPKNQTLLFTIQSKLK